MEQLINSLTIKENQNTYLRRKTNDFYNELKNISQHQFPYWSNLYLSSDSYQYTLERFWYGGSFDRGIFIKNRFDIDLYFVFKKTNPPSFILNPWSNYPNEQNNLRGN